MKRVVLLVAMVGMGISVNAQLGGLRGKLGKIGTGVLMKETGLDKILEAPEPVSTSFKDVNMEGSKMPATIVPKSVQPLYLLQKNASGGYLLCSGYYEMTNKSYCLHAGTFGPSAGDGYMYAPMIGAKEDVIKLILHRAESQPDVKQHDIQILLWAIVAKTRFSDFGGSVKATAVALLQPKELTMLQGGSLGVLPSEVMDRLKNKMPAPLQMVFEAENNIRQLVAGGNYSYAEMEQYAIRAGMAPPRSDVPSGIWTLHPDGYYVRYIPSGYSQTKVQVYVPKELIADGKKLVYNAVGSIACPANTGSQRLAQTNEPLNPKYGTAIKTDCN